MHEQHVAVDIGDEVQESRIWDAKVLGRIIAGGIARSGLETYPDVIVEMNRRTGITCHPNTLSDIKTGKRLPSLELMTALMITLNLRHSEVAEAVVEELRDKYRALYRS